METQAVTHMRDQNGASTPTMTVVYRPLSTQSALSQAGAIQPGESAATAVYYNPRTLVDVPDELIEEVFPQFTEWTKKLTAGGGDWPPDKLTERGTLEFFGHLRYVLLRGAAVLQEQFPRFALFRSWPFTSEGFLRWAPRARLEISKLSASHTSASLQRTASAEVVAELRHLSAQARTRDHTSGLGACVSLRPAFLIRSDFAGLGQASISSTNVLVMTSRPVVTGLLLTFSLASPTLPFFELYSTFLLHFPTFFRLCHSFVSSGYYPPGGINYPVKVIQSISQASSYSIKQESG